MKTYITDNFPLKDLECAYMDICRDYCPQHQASGTPICGYAYPCELRQWFKEVIEERIPRKNLELQVKLILDERK